MNAGHRTLFSWILIISCCLVVSLGLDLVLGQLMVLHTYFYYFMLSLTGTASSAFHPFWVGNE